MQSLDQMPAQIAKICADQMTMHTSSYAAIIIMFFLFMTLGYACMTSLNRRINRLENKFDMRLPLHAHETTHLIPGHARNHSV